MAIVISQPNHMGRRATSLSADIVSQLGKVSDPILAELAKCSPDAIRRARIKAGIKSAAPDKLIWTAEMDSMLGESTDEETAAKLGITRHQVWWRRAVLGVSKQPPRFPGAPKGNQNAAKAATERLPWRLPVAWGIRDAIEKAAKAKKIKPAEVLKATFGVANV